MPLDLNMPLGCGIVQDCMALQSMCSLMKNLDHALLYKLTYEDVRD